jgi:hypothetical protein
MTVVLPYLDQVVKEHGVTNAGHVVGIGARRIVCLRGQVAVTPEVADRVVIAAAGPIAWYDDPTLRRFWFASLPSDTLYCRAHKRAHARAAERRQARELVVA